MPSNARDATDVAVDPHGIEDSWMLNVGNVLAGSCRPGEKERVPAGPKAGV